MRKKKNNNIFYNNPYIRHYSPIQIYKQRKLKAL